MTAADNSLTPPQLIPGHANTSSPDVYAEEKELYLGSLCSSSSSSSDGGAPWSFWTLMAKSGNIDHSLNLCPATGTLLASHAHKSVGSNAAGASPGSMNQPAVFHTWSQWKQAAGGGAQQQPSLSGTFWGSWDVDNPSSPSSSLFSTTWSKETPSSPTLYRHKLRASEAHPWVMWYMRSDSVTGGNGGYPWPGAGVLLEHGHASTQLRVFLNVTSSTSQEAQFYLPEISGCWKNDGSPCDGDLSTDVTRYVCFIINPGVPNHCTATNQGLCPPYHVRANGSVVYRNDTANFPYSCYYFYCEPSMDGVHGCDPYSNPNPQEIMQVLPCAEWAGTGFPTRKGQGWVGDARMWTLDVGALQRRL